MKILKVKGIFLLFLGAFYVGLFLTTDILWIRVISLICVLGAFCVKHTWQRTFAIFVMVFFDSIMFLFSHKEIPGWGARIPIEHIGGIDTVWGRDGGYVDSLIFTVVHDKKCIVPKNGWYNKYIKTMAADIQLTDENDGLAQDTEMALTNGFEEVGWMHIDVNFLLLSDEANARFKEGERVLLYIKPADLLETDTVAVWNDAKGNIYVEAYNTDESK